jgi:hypothetical protein
MVVMNKLGCFGNGSSVGRMAKNCGFSVGAVDLFTKRVFQAIIKFRKLVIRWPSKEERIEIIYLLFGRVSGNVKKMMMTMKKTELTRKLYRLLHH